MKCSPTPWRVEYQKRFPAWDDRSDPRVVDANGRSIMAPNVDHPGQVDEIKIANCQLAAASPSMLAELRRVRAWMEDCMIDTQNIGLPSRQRYDAVCLEIAKAEGVTV